MEWKREGRRGEGRERWRKVGLGKEGRSGVVRREEEGGVRGRERRKVGLGKGRFVWKR